MVVFVHGSGSSRFSPRNQAVASALNEAGLATLLFDLLTPQQAAIDERTAEFRLDIGRRARRTSDTVHWLAQAQRVPQLPIGLFAASTGATSR
jgi:putative phosphoribosyl transferase